MCMTEWWWQRGCSCKRGREEGDRARVRRVEGVMTRSAQDRGGDRGGKRLRSSPRGSSLASVILGPFTQSPLLQGFPSPHGHHYKMEQLHLIRLQRVARLPHPKTSEKRRLQVTQRSGRNFKEMQNYSAISGATTELLWSQGIIWPREVDSKELKTEKAEEWRQKHLSSQRLGGRRSTTLNIVCVVWRRLEKLRSLSNAY